MSMLQMKSACFSMMVEPFVLVTLLGIAIIQVGGLNFSYPTFPNNYEPDLITTYYSRIALNALQVTLDVSNNISNLSGRVLYKQKFKLWSRSTNATASFNTTFVLNITPKTQPGGEGMAFILTENPDVPDNSVGQWLGIVNATTNGSTQAQIVAIEFDTRKSFAGDIDDNHVAVNLNSIKSINQSSLSSHGINLSNGTDVIVNVQYDGKLKTIVVFLSMANGEGFNVSKPVLSSAINLHEHLPQDVYVGFSASTGNLTQLNCIKSWNFIGEDISEDSTPLLWLWITIPVVVLLLAGLACYLCWKKLKKDGDPEIKRRIKDSATGPREFRLKELKSATKSFHSRNKLGQGGSGAVYKGFLENKDVAVKRLTKDSHQGKEEFIAEVTTISHLEHKNLVKLIGWCCESNELLLVYKFMPNGSLEKLLFSDESLASQAVLQSWKIRHSIICGVAYALEYLHVGCNNRVLHRDVKASNVLLDSEYNALLGDFGLARIIEHAGKTHHSTKDIAGTPGYMAPEYVLDRRASMKTDVYGFGVFVMEVTSGRMPVNNANNQDNRGNYIVDWLWDLYGKERILDALDTKLQMDLNEDQMERTLKLGLACCHPDPNQRPLMSMILQVLTGETTPPIVPTDKPAFIWPIVQDDSEPSSTGNQETPSTELSSA